MVLFATTSLPGKRAIRNRLAMPRVCPRCKSSLGDEASCPNCGFQVVTPPEIRRPPRRRAPSSSSKWQQTAWGKTLIGLLLAQGLYYGLLMLVRTVASAMGEEASSQEWMGSFNGLLLIQVLQLVSLLAGGMVAGAGQRRGVLYGAIVGMYNGVLFLAVYVLVLGQTLRPEALVMLPILQIAFGTAGGFIGNTIWKPIQQLTTLSPVEEGGVGALGPRAPADITVPPPKLPRVSPLAGPINWVGVAGGTLLAVLGTIGARSVFNIIMAGTDAPPLDTQRQAQFLTWEISVLALLIGGAFAGSNSSNGFKQGLLVGSIASFLLVIIYLWKGDNNATDTPTWVFSFFGFKGSAMVERIVFTVLSVMPLGIAGGWFGGQLLPPVILPPRQKRMLPGSM